MGQMRKAKDVLRLSKTIASFSDSQATIVDTDDSDNLNILMVRIKPNSGLYLGGTFDFEINLDSYPENSPSVKCVTKIYHPNIDCMEEDDNVCLNLLDSGWSPEITLEDLVQGFLFLLYNPNLEDPLSPLFDSETSYQEYADNVAKSLKGAQIDDFKFDFNFLSECESGDSTKGDNCDTDPTIDDKPKDNSMSEVTAVPDETGDITFAETCPTGVTQTVERQSSKADVKIVSEDMCGAGCVNCVECDSLVTRHHNPSTTLTITPLFTDSLIPEINLVTKMFPKFLNQFLCCVSTQATKRDL